MFSTVYAWILRGLPFEDPGALIAISRTRPAQNLQFMPLTIHDFEADGVPLAVVVDAK